MFFRKWWASQPAHCVAFNKATYILLFLAIAATTPNAWGIEHKSVADFGADGVGDDTVQLQNAINWAMANPCVLNFPAASYTVSTTLLIENPGGTKASSARLSGRGARATTINFTGATGPLFKVVGVKTAGQFLYDFGIEGMKLSGRARDANEHGVQLMGCFAPVFKNVTFTGFGGDGIHVYGDPTINPNPDFTSTNFLTITQCSFERLRGRGFFDNHPIGCASLTIEQSLFNMCGTGAARIQSASFVVDRCAFASSGWSGETTPINVNAIGLQIGDLSSGSVSRGLVRGCEFDANRAEHLRMDNFSLVRLENNRFIFNDRFNSGYLTPPIGANMAPKGAPNMLLNIVIDGLFFRIDTAGTATGIKWTNPNFVDETSVRVDGLRVTNAPGAAFTTVQGAP